MPIKKEYGLSMIGVGNMSYDHTLDSSKIIDDMTPYEFRFKSNQDFSAFMLPLTKNQWNTSYRKI